MGVPIFPYDISEKGVLHMLDLRVDELRLAPPKGPCRRHVTISMYIYIVCGMQYAVCSMQYVAYSRSYVVRSM